jgi:ATP synthase protein I
MRITFLREENMNRRQHPPRPKKEFSAQSGLGFALQLGAELTSGILVGLLMGYAIDHVFDTQPWGLVGMVLLGFAAGILNIFRLMGIGKAPEPPQPLVKPGDNQDG